MLRAESFNVLQIQTHEKGYGKGGCIIDQGGKARKGEEPIIQKQANFKNRLGRAALKDEEDH